MELIIVRHGQTEWSLSGRHTGVTEIDLTTEGEVEAIRLAPILDRILGGRSPTLFVSPRKRALATAALALPGFTARVEPLLAEYGYGSYEGLTREEIQIQVPGWEIWNDGCPDGETLDQVGLRADRFIGEQVIGVEGPVVAVTHGHYSRILAARALDRSARDGSLFDSATASVSVIKEVRGRHILSLWNLTADLFD